MAKESAVASGTIYRHFPNKPELVAEVFRYATEREVAAVAQACAIGRTLAYGLIGELNDYLSVILLRLSERLWKLGKTSSLL
jgi:AcrR family transcriptional regulator